MEHRCRKCGCELTEANRLRAGYTCRTCDNARRKAAYYATRKEPKPRARATCSQCACELTPENRRNGKCKTCDNLRHKERYYNDRKAAVARVLHYNKAHAEQCKARNRTVRARKRADPAFAEAERIRLAALPKSAELRCASVKRHRMRYPDQHRMNYKRWRARLRGAKGNFTRAEWQAQLAWFGHRCAYCGGTHDITADHVIDLNRGGEHTFENIVPACRSCNSRKKHRGILSMVNVSFAPEVAHGH